MLRELPERPNLENLKNQAKTLLKSIESGDVDALSRAKVLSKSTALRLSDAQFIIAREYGFSSWAKLKRHVESIGETTRDLFLQAVCDGQLERAQGLVEDLPERDLACAAVLGDTERVRRLLRDNPANAISRVGPKHVQPIMYVAFSPFHRENPTGVLEAARLLLECGADPNAYYIDGEWPDAKLPPLWAATSEANNPALARLLLERGANPDDCESVYHSAQFFHEECLQVLEEFGADLSGPFVPWNNTPLYFLMGHQPGTPGVDVAMRGVRWLLEHGADPNKRSYQHQESALHGAIRNGHSVETVAMLLEHGADPNAKRADGKTPYELAARQGRTDLTDMLTQFGAETLLDTTDRFLGACARGDLAMAKGILDASPELHAELSTPENVALVEAAWTGNTRMVTVMLELGFDPNQTNSKNITALHNACWWGRIRAVRALLAHGARIDVVENEYQARPLGWAVHGSLNCRNPEGNYPETVSLLLKAGAVPEEHMLANAEPAVLEVLNSHTVEPTL